MSLSRQRSALSMEPHIYPLEQWPWEQRTGREVRTKVLGRNESSWFEKQQRSLGEEIVLPPEVEEKRQGPVTQL